MHKKIRKDITFGRILGNMKVKGKVLCAKMTLET